MLREGDGRLLKFLQNLFNNNDKEILRLSDMVRGINRWEDDFKALSDEALREKTNEFKARLAKGETLDDLLGEAFAVVKEASRRTLGQVPFDEQLMGGIVLHEGNIAEMKTGEGKTLTAVLPVYLNALAGKGVHVVTVNDYLAKRDAEWMGRIYRFLGMTVGALVHGLDTVEKRRVYECDITYGTNNEFGFDYLRDNMVFDADDMVQRELNYAIVDEVDSILIDEARTPLIISGQAEKSNDLYYRFAKIMPKLQQDAHYTLDEKAHTVSATEEGISRVEELLGIGNLYDSDNMDMAHYLQQALKAHALMKRDKDYIVKDGEVIIVDEFTGRLMYGRRYSDGLHQAIEAKEGVRIEHESQTLASITIQNYFRMYTKLAGMTGTAETEKDEFAKIYNLGVVVIPTHRDMIRVDHPDVVYKTEAAKFNAVVNEIVGLYEKGQPVLVGTISIEKSEKISGMLKRKGIPHQVLNAKHHEKEAEIVKLAGQAKTVTIATNMAGRGTDIVLGEGVPELGGLHIIGTERHESRRIDNQLRGRSGRQGDPGSSRFYVSLEDDLMRLFGGETITAIMNRLGWEEDQPIEHARIAKSIESAQKKIEARNFDIRKHVLEYDDVMNKQREVIYEKRKAVLRGESLKDGIADMLGAVIDRFTAIYCDEKIFPEEWDLDGLVEHANHVFVKVANLSVEKLKEFKTRGPMAAMIKEEVLASYSMREQAIGLENMRQIERVVMLKVIDEKWMAHLQDMDDLREGIGLRAYGQKDPLMEYKFEAFNAFKEMMNAVEEDVARYIFRVEVVSQEEQEQERRRRMASLQTNREASFPVPRVASGKVGRNDPCPCGSGKKYKRCCGQ